jgi:hypothetical protein
MFIMVRGGRGILCRVSLFVCGPISTDQRAMPCCRCFCDEKVCWSLGVGVPSSSERRGLAAGRLGCPSVHIFLLAEAVTVLLQG